MNKSTVLLTGGTGFLGSNILKRLLLENHKVILLKREKSKIERIENEMENIVFYNLETIELDKIFQENDIDIVIHCATHYGRKDSNPIEVIEANLILPLKLLYLSIENKVSIFINTDTILDKRINYYSLSKSQFKNWLEKMSKDIIAINMELEHFYGPYDDDSKFVTYIIKQLLNNVDAIDLTLGEQERYFVYIDDVVDAFCKVIMASENYINGYYSFQVATENPITIREFVEKIRVLCNNNKTALNFGSIPYRENEIMKLELNINPLSNIGWIPSTKLEVGLIKTINEQKGRK